MRIVGGKFKGRNIIFLKNSRTRPLKDFVKENIFNVLTHSKLLKIDIKNSSVLDLYSGIGSFGLECVSRGSKNVTFVEENKEAINTLKKNISNNFIATVTNVVFDKNLNFLKRKIVEKFNIFFLDPPFANNDFLIELKTIKEKKIFSQKHVVIIHREVKTNDNFSDIIKPLLIKKYRRSKIIFGIF